jgi:hypothetical protein
MSAPAVAVTDLAAILRLRAVVCRAAQRDSLGWWDDESLTPYARVILDPLFPRTAPSAALKVAFVAARLRYRAAFAPLNGRILHLFALDHETELRLVGVEPDDITPGEDPIPDAEAFRRVLGSDWRDYEIVDRGAAGLLEIWPRGVRLEDAVETARALASAHAEGGPGAAVFPFVRVS